MKGVKIRCSSVERAMDFGASLLAEFERRGAESFLLVSKGAGGILPLLHGPGPGPFLLALFKGRHYLFPDEEGFERIFRFLNAKIGVVVGDFPHLNIPEVALSPEDGGGEAVIASFGGEGLDLDRPSFSEISKLAEFLKDSAFYLPSMDCGRCGFETCRELLFRITGGDRRASDCLELTPDLKIAVGGREIPMAPFIREMIRGCIRGLLKPMKGVEPARVEIEMEWKGVEDGA